jgi:hypothetical protein
VDSKTATKNRGRIVGLVADSVRGFKLGIFTTSVLFQIGEHFMRTVHKGYPCTDARWAEMVGRPQLQGLFQYEASLFPGTSYQVGTSRRIKH